MSNMLEQILEEFPRRLAEYSDYIPRDVRFTQIDKKIDVAIGMRRTGKTSLMFQTIRQLLDAGVPKQRILCLNFEDDRLLPCNHVQLASLLEAFYSIYPENHTQKCYLFLDEIQNVENWAIVIRRFFDTKQVKIYLTGSSAKLLSKEIATSLRGRSIATEVWPLSFSEYLLTQQIKTRYKTFGKATMDKLNQYFLRYLTIGGFPEVVNLPTDHRNRVLQEYVDVVIYRDIIERHDIKNTQLMKYMIKTLLNSTAAPFSVNKFFNDLKSQGISIGKATLYDYLSYIEDAYLCFVVPLFSESIRKVQTNPRKVYAIDPGLMNAYHFNLSSNLGRMFETLVYIQLRRQGCKIYYYLTKDRYEIDFLVRTVTNELKLYQVVWDVNDKKTMDREMRALQQANQELGVTGLLLTPEVFIRHGLVD
jgi:uncharacterized protein